MKVLHVGEYVHGGVATYIKTLLNHPNNLEIEDYLICSDYNSEHDWNIKEDHVKYYSYKRSLKNILSAIKSIRSYIKKVNPDIIYCHSTWAGLFVRLPLLITPKSYRVIYNAHGWAFLRDTTMWKKKLYGFIERILSLRTDVIINVSKYEYRAALNVGINQSKLQLTFSGISPTVSEIPEIQYPKNCVNLLFVGRFDAPKGIDYLLQCFNQCQREDIFLMVVGDNVVGDSEKIEMVNSKKVSFVGWVPHEQIGAYYKGCDVVVLPSRWEAFGLVGIEAMKHGKPIIVSNRGALPELVQEGKNGYIFDFEKPDSLIKILNTLDKKMLVLLRKKAREVFEQTYISDKMLEKTFLIYKGRNTNESHD